MIERPASEHSRACAIFTSGHEQSKGGKPGRFRRVACDCFLA